MAKEYQVKAVIKAIEKLKGEDKEISRDGNMKPEKAKTREKKHGKK